MDFLVFGLGTTEIVLIVLVVLLLFGGTKLPQLMRGMGRGVREFKEGMNTPIEEQEKQEAEKTALERERKMQEAMLDIKKKFGKNAILKGMSLEEGATAMERNRQIGGHKA